MFRRKTKEQTNRRRTTERLSRDAPAFSYYSNRSRIKAPIGRRLEPDAIKRLQGPPWWHQLPSILAAIAVLISLGSISGLNTDPKVIQPNNGNAALLRDKGTYQKVAKQFFNASLLNRSKITVNVEGITRDMKRAFPELADVSITLPLIGRRPIIYVEPSAPAIVLSARNGMYVLNKKGRAVIATNRVNNLESLHLPVVTDENTTKIEAGKGILPGSNVEFITSIMNQLNAKKLDVQSLTLPVSANELDIRINGKPYVIKLNLLNDARQQVGAFLAVKQKLEAERQEPAEYFDVRVEERVYYK